MTFDPRSAMGFQQVPRSSVHPAKLRLPLAELDRVSIGADVRSDEGHTVPAGSTGTVVAVWNGGEAYDIEFTKPIEALATVQPGTIVAVETRRR